MYNLTVDEAHTFFVGAGDWLVHNTCADWVDDLIKNRTVASPGGVDPETAVNAVYERLSLAHRTDYMKKQSISVLEVDGNMYLGFNGDLDRTVLGLSGNDYREYLLKKGLYPGLGQIHAERMALNEYYVNSTRSGRVGRMYTNREVCDTCLANDGITGGVINGLQATSLERLEMTFRLNSITTGQNTRFPQLSHLGRGMIVVDSRGWRIR